MNRSKQAGMGKKTIIVLLVGLALASVHLAEAQQAKKYQDWCISAFALRAFR